MSSAEASLPKPGDVIAGKYRVGRTLGSGGMGVVFEATHVKLEQRVAIKVLKTGARAPHAAARLEREARVSARLRSSHVARVMDVDVTTSGVPYIVMEFLEGHDLGEELRSRGPLPVPDVVDWMLQICSAMAEAHALGVVHRDLKPSNLFLANEDGRRTIKVLDFGISKVADEPTTTLTRSVLGTPQYMSPEQVRSAKHIDWRADVWALGVISYELLAGQLPFDGETPTAIAAAIVADAPRSLSVMREDVPKALEAAIWKALSKNVSDRFDSVRAFALAIAQFSDGESVAPISSKSLRRPSRRLPSSTPESDTTPPSDESDAPTSGRAVTPKAKLRYGAAALALLLSGVIAALWSRQTHRPDEREVRPAPQPTHLPAPPSEAIVSPPLQVAEPLASAADLAKAVPRSPPKRSPQGKLPAATSSAPATPAPSPSSDPLYL
jgi:serine/threonine-protein kinase